MEGATSSICLGIADHGICFDFAKTLFRLFPVFPVKFYPGEFDGARAK